VSNNNDQRDGLRDSGAYEGDGRDAGSAGEFVLHTRRVQSFDARRCGVAFALLACVTVAIAVVFAALGAWLILPFAGLEAVALILAFDWFARHAADSESLEIRGNAVRLAVREQSQTRHYELNRAWAQVVVDVRASNMRIALRSHGREIEIGRYLDAGGKQHLARELRSRLGASGAR
jgi:uncharacterized membrane protein